MTITETGTFATSNGARYLQQLCKHFAHKIPVEYDAEKGTADLPPGPARLTATDAALRVEITASDEDGLKLARHIIDDHLKRFAFREDFSGMDWAPV
ncbi:hypothetical protein SAMN05216196_1011202 [Lutimaribacter pacificus]|uniref:2,4-dihydroxyhept-2-ene-1,7-dioic acid aldolase n=1 Tax=Lutimaribacter pacificus TaxID=391948 RepID=A0A1H0D5L2_9RHOB|nr:DUF2218 domain-containing protein [Lutimaribacter pacificus]SDN65454.1 hypothetical protein SAMN05216196_1011202 [Lutimaribacter pacificus]SHJ36554.1 hypothetical protein SAMN05444142_10115 [Lutimaribacter pacificus]